MLLLPPPAAVGREKGYTLAGAGGPVETDHSVYVLRLAEFRFRRSGMKSNHFSRKSHFREKYLSRSERASKASAMSGAHPSLFRAQRSGSEKLFDKLRFVEIMKQKTAPAFWPERFAISKNIQL